MGTMNAMTNEHWAHKHLDLDTDNDNEYTMYNDHKLRRAAVEGLATLHQAYCHIYALIQQFSYYWGRVCWSWIRNSRQCPLLPLLLVLNCWPRLRELQREPMHPSCLVPGQRHCWMTEPLANTHHHTLHAFRRAAHVQPSHLWSLTNLCTEAGQWKHLCIVLWHQYAQLLQASVLFLGPVSESEPSKLMTQKVTRHSYSLLLLLALMLAELSTTVNCDLPRRPDPTNRIRLARHNQLSWPVSHRC